MSRIASVSDRRAPLLVRLVYRASRRATTKLLRRSETATMEPLALHAHRPWHLGAFVASELAIQRSTRTRFSLKELARARTGMLVGCPW